MLFWQHVCLSHMDRYLFPYSGFTTNTYAVNTVSKGRSRVLPITVVGLQVATIHVIHCVDPTLGHNRDPSVR
jgi:hypothetical protein